MSWEWLPIALGASTSLFSLGVFWFCWNLFKESRKSAPNDLRRDFERIVEEVRGELLRMRSEMNDLTEDIVTERERASVERKRLSMERARQTKRDNKEAQQLLDEPQIDDLESARRRATAAGVRLI